MGELHPRALRRRCRGRPYSLPRRALRRTHLGTGVEAEGMKGPELPQGTGRGPMTRPPS